MEIMAKPVNCASHQFKPFEWLQRAELDFSQHDQAAFLNDARDIVHGAHMLVQLLAWDEDRHDAAESNPDAPPLLDACQRSSMQRFVAVALDMLHARIEAQCEAMS